MSNYNVYNYSVLTFTYVLHIRSYNLFATCKNVLSLNLYFKPNDAIWKRHLFSFKPQRRHLASEFQSLGPQGLGEAWRFQNLKALGVPLGFPSWPHTEENIESLKRAKLDAIL